MNRPSAPPLSGIRVIEVGQLLAGPFAGTLLGYFGADVIKVEPPGEGDPIRGWRHVQEGTSLWWRSLARNKRCITLDLKHPKGRDILLRLIDTADVLIENFRPGAMERWGLGPDDVKARNPGLIYSRISGYGQTGPYASKPGYASVCEGFSGFRHVNGFPGQAPVRPNLSLGDSLAGLHAAFGIVMALLARQRSTQKAGQVVDVALFESIFNLMEAVVPEFDGAGVVRQPSGTTVTGIVPTNTYQCADEKYIIIGGNGDSIFKRLMNAIGRPDLAEDPGLGTNLQRVANEARIDDAISDWTRQLPCAEAVRQLEQADVPAGPIYSVAEMMNDPHYQARSLFEEVQFGDRSLKIPAIVPKLSQTPGRTEWAGPDIGAHTDEVFRADLGMSEADVAALKAEGVI